MRLFIRNVVFFLAIPFALWLVAELVLPSTYYTFRAWEALASKSGFLIGPFYPRMTYHLIEKGDLAPHSKYAVEKEVRWTTDELGYRNDKFNSTPDILLIGDSNIAGSSLSQEETLTATLSEHTGLSVYNIAPSDMESFTALKNGGGIAAPRMVVFSIMERSIPLLQPSDPSAKRSHLRLRLNPIVQHIGVKLDKLYKGNSLKFIKSIARGSYGMGVQSAVDSSIFFLQGDIAVINVTDEGLELVVKTIESYKQYCDLIGSEFVFVPIPNKETILWQYTGITSQPDFIGLLNHKLKERGITTIEVVEPFNELVKDGNLPYHSDDSHWNKFAVDLVAKKIALLPYLGELRDRKIY